MSYETITVERRFDNRVTEITLGPPPGNIVTCQLMEELTRELAAHEEEEHAGTRAIVIAGGGKHFSYGASVEEHKPGVIGEVLPDFHLLIGRMLDCPIPTIARVSGLCLGGGFEVALGCSMIIADAGARFGLPEIKLGVFPPVGAVLLPRMIGPAMASEVVLTGEQFGAEELHRRGLVNHVTDTATSALDTYVDEYLTANLLPKSASSLRHANRAARFELAAHYHKNIAVAEQLYLDELMSTADAVEGITSFLEKRKPEWQS